jgi:hypothetical protein
MMIDVATSFCDVHRHALEEFKHGLAHSRHHHASVATPRHHDADFSDGTQNVRTFQIDQVAMIVCREAEHDLQLAHDIFDMIPHESVMGRSSLTTICIRHILRSSERAAFEHHEAGGLEPAEYELVASAISRCSTMRSLTPTLCSNRA